MDILKLSIQGISHSITRSGAYALILEEIITKTKLPVVIGSAEAQSITIAVEKDLKAPRPLTHDLFTSFIKKMHYKVSSVLIHSIKDGIFYSEIHFENGEEKIVMDARTSDAVSLAIRFDADVFTTSEVLEIAGIKMDLSPESGSVSDESLEGESVKNINEDNTLPENDQDDVTLEIMDFTKSSAEMGIKIPDLSEDQLNLYLSMAVQNENFDLAIELQEELINRFPKQD